VQGRAPPTSADQNTPTSASSPNFTSAALSPLLAYVTAIYRMMRTISVLVAHIVAENKSDPWALGRGGLL